MENQEKKEKHYMNLNTGSVATYDGWWYENDGGETVNAVDEEYVEEVVFEDGEWVAPHYQTCGEFASKLSIKN